MHNNGILSQVKYENLIENLIEFKIVKVAFSKNNVIKIVMVILAAI